jgi:glycerophosphoryl diester phosphodiesterase
MSDWLTARPVAHRGLHDAAAGVIENTPSAFRAAIAGNYAIECDVQITADGEAMVYHDDKLGRLTEGTDRLAAVTAADLKRVAFRATGDRMLTLGELCELVAGRVALFVELKSQFDGDRRLATGTAKTLATYRGPVAAMSFDPEPIAVLREMIPPLRRGLVAQRRERPAPGSHSGSAPAPFAYFAMRSLAARPHFLAYRVKDLSSALPRFVRGVLGLPLLTWTVRTPQDRALAARWADQIIFEGFRP